MLVLSLGAGVQSSTLALMCAHGEFEMPDCAIFADTQAEPESVYNWLDWLEKQLPFPVYRVTSGSLAKKALTIMTSKKGKKYQSPSIPFFTSNGFSRQPGKLSRQCTRDFKVCAIERKIRELRKGNNVVYQYIGISWDELHRMKDSRRRYIINRYPLIEKRIRRVDCLRWMREHGYPKPPRSACIFCPYHSNAEWERLKTEEPGEFKKVIEFEKKYQKVFSKINTFNEIPFLHRQLKPIDQVYFPQKDQFDLFGNECEGMCGV